MQVAAVGGISGDSRFHIGPVIVEGVISIVGIVVAYCGVVLKDVDGHIVHLYFFGFGNCAGFCHAAAAHAAHLEGEGLKAFGDRWVVATVAVVGHNLVGAGDSR